MNKTTKQRRKVGDNEAQAPDAGGEENSLADTRAEMNHLFAVASESFKSMSEGNSHEFLRRSRQTGGQ